MNTLISVVIPAYKAGKYIAEAIVSVLSQKHVEVELIVIEDGRVDNTGLIVKKYNNKVKLITLEKNQGACFARNTGLDKSTGDYVMFLDADDYLEGDVLFGLLNSLIKFNSSVAFGPCKMIYPSHPFCRIFRPPKEEEPLSVIARWISGNSGPGTCSILWRKSEIVRIGGWNSNFHRNQDGEVIIRAMFNKCTVSSSNDGFGVYRQHENSRITTNFSTRAFESLKALDLYIRSQIAENPEYEYPLLNALDYFSATTALKAYNSGQSAIGFDWEAKWNRATPRIKDLKFINKKVFFIHLLYRMFGVNNGDSVFNKLLLAKHAVESKYSNNALFQLKKK